MKFNLLKRVQQLKRHLLDEKGASTIEYVGMAAVAVAIVGSILFAMSAGGGADIGQAVADTIHGMIAGLGGGGDSGPISVELSPSESPVPRPMLDEPLIPSVGIIDFLTSLFQNKPVEEKYPADKLVQELKNRGGEAEELVKVLEEKNVKITWISAEEMKKFTGCEKGGCFGLQVSGRNEIFLNRDALNGVEENFLLAVLVHEATHVKQAVDDNALPDADTIANNRNKSIDDYVKDSHDKFAKEMSGQSPEEIREEVFNGIYQNVNDEVEAKNNEAEFYRNSLNPIQQLVYDLNPIPEWVSEGVYYLTGIPAPPHRTTPEDTYRQYKRFYQDNLNKSNINITLPPTYEELQRQSGS